MIKKILLGLAAVVGVLMVVAAFRPVHFSVSREMVMNASAEKIFPYINNSKKADGWMPWAESDPGVKMVYSGPEEGVGAKSSWDSKGNMGTGEALVVESVKNQTVKTQLSYTKPFTMSQLAEISLAAEGGATKVKWTVSGENGYLMRLFGLFMDCDKMIGGEFNKGLSKLKSQVEAN